MMCFNIKTIKPEAYLTCKKGEINLIHYSTKKNWYRFFTNKYYRWLQFSGNCKQTANKFLCHSKLETKKLHSFCLCLWRNSSGVRAVFYSYAFSTCTYTQVKIYIHTFKTNKCFDSQREFSISYDLAYFSS